MHPSTSANACPCDTCSGGIFVFFASTQRGRKKVHIPPPASSTLPRVDIPHTNALFALPIKQFNKVLQRQKIRRYSRRDTILRTRRKQYMNRRYAARLRRRRGITGGV